MFAVITSRGGDDVYAASLLDIGRSERCLTTFKLIIDNGEWKIGSFLHVLTLDRDIGRIHTLGIGRQTDVASVGGRTDKDAVDATLHGQRQGTCLDAANPFAFAP